MNTITVEGVTFYPLKVASLTRHGEKIYAQFKRPPSFDKSKEEFSEECELKRLIGEEAGIKEIFIKPYFYKWMQDAFIKNRVLYVHIDKDYVTQAQYVKFVMPDLLLINCEEDALRARDRIILDM